MAHDDQQIRGLATRQWSLPTRQIILASTSPTRQKMLNDCGLAFIAKGVSLDEGAIRAACVDEGMSALDIAILLAQMKAQRVAQGEVAQTHPDALIIGCDQILECDGVLFGKPKDREAAAKQLADLSAKPHQLVTAAVIMADGARIWHCHATPRLTMCRLSPSDIEGYLDKIGDAAFESPGCYQIEGIGAQILQKIEGDPYAILGMPLLDILAFLRTYGLRLAPPVLVAEA